MTWIASSSISRRTAADGQAPPRMCSFRFSPVPTPSMNRPGSSAALVAAACAMMAGWIRTVGQVTPVTMESRWVTWEMPPMTLQTNGDWPCVSTQGW